MKLSKRDLAMAKQIAAELGRAGGLERAARMTKQQRKDSAKHAAKARWSRVPVPSKETK